MASSEEKLEAGDAYALGMLEAMDTSLMTTEEMLRELVLGQREMRALVKKFVADVEKNPMFATMGKMFGGGKR